MSLLSSKWPALLILFGGVMAAAGSWVSSKRNDEQQVSIAKTGELNKELGQQIKALQGVNNDIATNTEKLVEENKKLTKHNLELSDKTNSLVQNIESLSKKVDGLLTIVHKEITGGNSIPLVLSKMYIDYTDNEKSKYALPPPIEFRNKRVVEFTIQNDGEYPLVDIRLFKTIGIYRSAIPEELEKIDYLRPGDRRSVLKIAVEGIEENYPVTYSLRIKWKTEYTYNLKVSYIAVGVDSRKTRQLDYTENESYLYKGVTYKTWPELEAKIRKDLN